MAEVAGEEGTPSAKTFVGGWLLALTATSTMAVSYFDRQTFAVLGPSVKAALGINGASYGLLISAFALAYLVGAPLSGRMIDAIGARRGLLGAVLAWSVVAALHALVPSLGVLFALRIALGLAESPSFPGAAQTMQRALPPRSRAAGFGILFSGSSFGAMLAPPVATWLAARYGFRFAFLGTAIVGLLWVPLWIAVAFRKRARELLDRAPEPLEAVAASLEKPSRLGAFSIITTTPVLRLIIIVFAAAPLLNLMYNFSSTYLVEDHHIAQADVGRYLWFPPLVYDAGSITFGALQSRFGGKRVSRKLVAFALALTGLAVVVPFAGGPLNSMMVASVAMAGGAGLYALGLVDALAEVPPRYVSTVGGIGAAAQSLAHIVVSPLIGGAVDVSGNYTGVFIALALWCAPGTLIWMAWRSRPPAVVADVFE